MRPWPWKRVFCSFVFSFSPAKGFNPETDAYVLFHLLPLDVRVALYNALIRPLFDFADTIWGDSDSITLMHDLQALQNKAAKVILDLLNYASSTDTL